MHRRTTRATSDREELAAPRRRAMRAALPSPADGTGAPPAKPTARVDVLASDPAILAELLDRIAAVAREPGVLEAAAHGSAEASPSPATALHARLRVIATKCKRASLRITFEGPDSATAAEPRAQGVERQAAAPGEGMPLKDDWTSDLPRQLTPDIATVAPDAAMPVGTVEHDDTLQIHGMPLDAEAPEPPGTLDAATESEPQPDYAQTAFTLQAADALDQFGPVPLAAKPALEARSITLDGEQVDSTPAGPDPAGSLLLRPVEHPSVSGSNMFQVVRVGPLLDIPERHPVRREDVPGGRPDLARWLRDVAARGQHDLVAAGAVAWSRLAATAGTLAASSRRQVSGWQQAVRSRRTRRGTQAAPMPSWVSQPLWRMGRQSIVPTSAALGAFFSVLVVGTVITTRPGSSSTLAQAASATSVSSLGQATQPVAVASLPGRAAGGSEASGTAGTGLPHTPSSSVQSAVNTAQPNVERARVPVDGLAVGSPPSTPATANTRATSIARAPDSSSAAPHSSAADAPSSPVPAPAPGSTARARRGEPMFVGTLEITSTPPGATVRIDNEAVGTTPLTLSRVRAGTRTVRIEHEGFARWSRAVLVPADQRARVKAVLDPAHMGPEGEKQ